MAMQGEGFEHVRARLDELIAKARAGTGAAVLVGYTARYAVYVHENLGAEQGGMKLAGKPRPSGLGVYWGPAGQPKFLEQPARDMKDELLRITANACKGGATPVQGLLVAGLRLQAASQQLVPVEYGFLRASAFTRVEEAGGQAAATQEEQGSVRPIDAQPGGHSADPDL